jgi:hypothetical protein
MSGDALADIAGGAEIKTFAQPRQSNEIKEAGRSKVSCESQIRSKSPLTGCRIRRVVTVLLEGVICDQQAFDGNRGLLREGRRLKSRAHRDDREGVASRSADPAPIDGPSEHIVGSSGLEAIL